MSRRVAWSALLLLTACAAQPTASSPTATPTRSASKLAVSSSTSPASPAQAAPTGTPLPAPVQLDLVQVLAVPVRALALGEGTRIAILSDEPYVGDARGLRPLPLPAALRPKPGDLEQVGIFFGRDNEPRIMGTRRSGSAEKAVYLRHLASGWRDGKEELGQLGGPALKGLWGVLGAADPELVCRSGAICIIKRNSGWTSVPAGTGARLVTLQNGVLWGLDATGISGIDAHGWSLALPAPAPPAWVEPRAFWATRDEAWVSSAQESFHFHAGAWSRQPSPVAEAAAWWGTAPDSLWVVGSAGAAHFDGQAFHAVSGLAGPLSVVRGRSDAELWFGGSAGLFRGRVPG